LKLNNLVIQLLIKINVVAFFIPLKIVISRKNHTEIRKHDRDIYGNNE